MRNKPSGENKQNDPSKRRYPASLIRLLMKDPSCQQPGYTPEELQEARKMAVWVYTLLLLGSYKGASEDLAVYLNVHKRMIRRLEAMGDEEIGWGYLRYTERMAKLEAAGAEASASAIPFDPQKYDQSAPKEPESWPHFFPNDNCHTVIENFHKGHYPLALMKHNGCSFECMANMLSKLLGRTVEEHQAKKMYFDELNQIRRDAGLYRRPQN